MKDCKIGVSQEFTLPDGNKKWFKHELTYDQETEEPPYAKANEYILQQAYLSGCRVYEHPSSYQVTPNNTYLPSIQVKPEDREIGLTVLDIMSCNSLNVLRAYYPQIKNNKSFEEAYYKRLSQLDPLYPRP
jgi:hypothetical protein